MRKSEKRIVDWLSENAPDSQQEKDEARSAVIDCGTYGIYSCENRRGTYYLRYGSDAPLVLRNEAQREFFLRKVAGISVPDELDEEFDRIMEDPDL